MEGELSGEGETTLYADILEGLELETGDLICTESGTGEILVGEFWRFLGRLLPGAVDHVVVYLGPDGLCVEAGPRGVNTFRFEVDAWDAKTMIPQRGPYVDRLIGAAYPLFGRGFAKPEETAIRVAVRDFCLAQAQHNKPYNFNFLDSTTTDAFYCSQLPYCAYLPHGIDLNTGVGVPELPGSEAIIFPQEIWSGCHHQAVNLVRQRG
jgi:hypothetical protein